MLNILNYKLYKHAWIDKCAPHHGEKLSQDDIRLLLSNGEAVRKRLPTIPKTYNLKALLMFHVLSPV